MSYLTFEKSKLINLEQSLFKEILRTNRAGSYMSSSIIGCNTRKYHGLLVCPLPDFDMMRHVLLSSLDVTVVQHERAFNLGIHKYNGNHYEPKGHKYIRELEFDVIPRKVYRVGGVLLAVEEVLVAKQERVLVKYTLLEANSDTKLKLKPFLANRSVHELTHENMAANTKYSQASNGISIKMYPRIPRLYMQLSKTNEFVANPDWYRGIEYFKEERRGYHYKEDLYVPGYFEVDIKKGESVIFSASLEERNPDGFDTRFNKELERRIPRDSVYNNLLNSAQQFFVSKDDAITMVAGYHWYGERLRDTLISVPQLTEALGDEKLFASVLDSSASQITKNIKDKEKLNMVEADTPLWFFWTLQQCWGETCIEKLSKQYYSFLKLVIESYLKGRFNNVKVQDNGLIVINDAFQPLTWMNGVVDGIPVTPRNGACVEINALWYNALHLFLDLAKEKTKDAGFIKKVKEVAEKLESSYLDTFWNEKDSCLYDVVDGEYIDASIRPNQIFVTAFNYSPLSNEQKKDIIDVVKEQLLTPKGLRSLSPKNPNYKGVMEGIAHKREFGLHQGAVWPWLISFYAEGYLKLHKQSGISHIKRIADNFSDEMTNHCIGTLSEYYDGNPPQMGKGAVSMAWNVAGVLKILKLIEKYS
ncbi:glycogen debranching enzyme N-terminal domain-containing protein [Plebeiibacterium marinum]|uniref:Amylo-alpha-1,6-glucosidase n=1 Tax=Plebeiibacterium marinum TaxID=2992111 RepID=A0AAE3SIW8_9BACT|nr:glycogen debranching enzyme N-terminal domain-containing protein [Plebeiobacterium marinum]MCW3805057.1 amylo-alpha-1,6-glucosidase [Plebeiobacterium marinum]